MRIVLLVLAILFAWPQQPTWQVYAAPIDTKAIRKFCDVGFRYTAAGLQIDIDRIAKLGIKLDSKALVALQGQAALKAQAMQYDCQMFAAGSITAEQFHSDLQGILSYANDVGRTADRAERSSGVETPEKLKEVDARYWADQLGIKIETIFIQGQEAGDPVVLLNRRLSDILKRYYCTCKPVQ